MPESIRQAWLPGRTAVISRVLQATVVGATLYVLDGALWSAFGSALGFGLLTLTSDAVEEVVGDYADNVFLGLLILGFTGVFLRSWLPGLIGGAVLGCWLFFDGVQHLRHGETRDELSVPYSHDGGPLTGIPRALGARVLEPFRL